jgi:ATP-binding cassette subfamily B protein
VSFAYNEKDGDTLRNVSFAMPPRTVTALVGASGSGETTAARLLQRFWDADGGNISINSADIRELSLDALRKSAADEVYDIIRVLIKKRRNKRWTRHDARPSGCVAGFTRA